MKLTLYMATSIDGYITRGESDSDWVSESDWDEFDKQVKVHDAVIMGRKTMDQFDDGEFPISGTYNIVMSHNSDLHAETANYTITNLDPIQAVDYAKSKGFQNLLLIGGSETNQQFLTSNLINEIILSVHPLVIGEGLCLFGDQPADIKLELIEYRTVNELIQLRYSVINYD